MERLSRHLTYANVVSTLCLFVLLGSAAYAATQLPNNSVGAKQLKKNAVTAPKIAADAVTGAKVADASLTGADIDSATLGKVPGATSADKAADASALQGRPASAFLGAGATAADAAKLGGRDPNAFGSVMIGSTPGLTTAAGPQSVFVPISGYGSSGVSPAAVEQTLPNQASVVRDIEVRIEGPAAATATEVFLVVNGFLREVCKMAAIPASCAPGETFNAAAGSQAAWWIKVAGGPTMLQAQLSFRLTPG